METFPLIYNFLNSMVECFWVSLSSVYEIDLDLVTLCFHPPFSQTPLQKKILNSCVTNLNLTILLHENISNF